MTEYFFAASAKIEKGPPNQTVKPGSTITLTAKISGDPEPDVRYEQRFRLNYFFFKLY